jgi:beta-lactamase regulating signal transducer with metallopeptidase domain
VENLYRTGLSNALSATVLALLVACLAHVLWRRPAILHCLWLLVLLKLVTPSLYEVPIPYLNSVGEALASESARDNVIVTTEPQGFVPSSEGEVFLGLETYSDIDVDRQPDEQVVRRPVDRPAFDWMRLAYVIWTAGSVVTFVVSFGRIRRFRVLLREAEPAGADTQEWVDELAISMGLEGSPSVWWVSGKVSPMVWSLGWRPQLILPRELWNGLEDQERCTLIIHELAHLRRGDHQLRYFELLVTGLYWWHPVLWWARRALRDAEEQCCDAWVVWALPGSAKSYARTLLETLDFLHQSDQPEPLLASGFGKVAHLRKRLTMIMNGTTPRLLGLKGTLGALGLALALLPVNASWAEKEDDDKDPRITVDTDSRITVDTDPRITVTVDGAGTSSASSTSTSVGGSSDATTQIVTASEDGKPDQIRVVVKSGDSAPVIASGSQDEVVKKLTDEIKEIAKKSKQSDLERVRRETLERVVKELKKSAAKLDSSGESLARGIKLQLQKDLQSQLVASTAEISKEAKAEIEKAQAKVAKLRADVQSKQRELTEAQTKLSKLMADRHVFRAEIRPDRGVRTITRVQPDNPGEKRIDVLEKKLDKLLDEVAALKKERGK